MAQSGPVEATGHSTNWNGGPAQAAEARTVPREQVHFRARAFGPDARSLHLTVVDISSRGLMARTERAFDAGDRLRVRLPVAGTVEAEVRWALGGRIGCRFEAPIPQSDYLGMLAQLLRD